jgi:hypothetical protein
MVSLLVDAEYLLPIETCESEFDTKSCGRMTHFRDKYIYSFERFTRMNFLSIVWQYPLVLVKKTRTLQRSIEFSLKIRIPSMSELDNHNFILIVLLRGGIYNFHVL